MNFRPAQHLRRPCRAETRAGRVRTADPRPDSAVMYYSSRWAATRAPLRAHNNNMYACAREDSSGVCLVSNRRHLLRSPPLGNILYTHTYIHTYTRGHGELWRTEFIILLAAAAEFITPATFPARPIGGGARTRTRDSYCCVVILLYIRTRNNNIKSERVALLF